MRLPKRHPVAIATAATLLIAVAAAALLGTQHESATAAPSASATPPAIALSVSITTPQRQVLARTVAASGSVVARDELIVGSDASGVRLVAVLVEAGASVKRGQLLAQGDDAQLLAQIAQQDAQIRERQAELAQAEANLKRALDIEDAGVFSDEAVLARRTAVQTLAARRDLARAQRQELDVRLAQTRVRAPSDGVISRSTATVGAVMQPGAELFRLIRDDQLEWLAELPAPVLAQVQPGAAVQISLDGSQTIVASVRQIAPTIDPRTRNGQVHVLLPRGTPLRAGAHASGTVTLGQAAAWTLPESSVIQRDGQSHVCMLGASDEARLVKITTGARQGGRIEVLEGTQPGIRIVATGAGFVKDGERVRVSGAPGSTREESRT